MTWVTALKRFSWKPTVNTTIDFKEGDKYNMPREAATALAEAGNVKISTKEKNGDVAGEGTAG